MDRMENPIDIGKLLGEKLQENRRRELYRDNMTKLEQQRANDAQYGGDHYKKMQIQPWDIVDEWPIEQQVGYHRGGALKYIMRMGTKDERLQEAAKAMHYVQKLVEVLEKADSKELK